MKRLFDILWEKSVSADSLKQFLHENMQQINDFHNSTYGNVIASRDAIERYILLKGNLISQLDFSVGYARSFVLILLDYCERFNLIAGMARIHAILSRNQIAINQRQQAALLFLYPRPVSNSQLVERFHPICQQLQRAVDTEEDTPVYVVATFCNYYSILVNDTPPGFAKQGREELIAAITANRYPFLNHPAITALAAIELDDTQAAYTDIQALIDQLLEKRAIPPTGYGTETDDNVLLIEGDTYYAELLQTVAPDFDSIRRISVDHATGMDIQRGVKILELESELFEYMKRFGNMHKAKLQVAYNMLPREVASPINLVDWGCGQGFASMLFIEQFGSESINVVTLIEPSEAALKRAALHLRKYAPAIQLKTVRRKLNELCSAHLTAPSTGTTVHLFSNILDIDDYSLEHLIHLIETSQTGMNTFVCVSPYIDEIKTERLESFMRYFKKNYATFDLLLDVQNSKKPDSPFWHCNNTYNNSRRKHGSYSNCYGYTPNGCNNKWTRVIKVFNIDLSKCN